MHFHGVSTEKKDAGASFSKIPETFRARKAIFSSSASKRDRFIRATEGIFLKVMNYLKGND